MEKLHYPDKEKVKGVRSFIRSYNSGKEPLAADAMADKGMAADRGLSTEFGAFTTLHRFDISSVDFQTRHTKERNLWFGIGLTKRLCSAFGIPKPAQDEAIRRFKIASERNVLKGKAMEAVVAALILGICRESGRPVNINELANAACSKPGKVFQIYKRLSRILGFAFTPVKAEDCVELFCEMVGLEQSTRTTVYRIVSAARNAGMNRSAKVLVAAAIHLATDILTQKELAKRLDVSVVSLRATVRELEKRLPKEILVPENR